LDRIKALERELVVNEVILNDFKDERGSDERLMGDTAVRVSEVTKGATRRSVSRSDEEVVSLSKP
jgi:hypothetical protein